MRFGKGLLIASLCAVPMIASAGFTPRDTFEVHSDVVSNNDPVNVPEPGTLALLLAGVGGVMATRRRRNDRDDR